MAEREPLIFPKGLLKLGPGLLTFPVLKPGSRRGPATSLWAVWNDDIVLGDNRQCVALRRFARFASLKKISP